MRKKNRKKSLLIILLSINVILLYPASFISAQDEVKIPEIPAEWSLHTQYSMNVQRDTLIKHLKEYDKRVSEFNSRCGGTISPDNNTLIAYCQKESAAIDIQSDAV